MINPKYRHIIISCTFLLKILYQKLGVCFSVRASVHHVINLHKLMLFSKICSLSCQTQAVAYLQVQLICWCWWHKQLIPFNSSSIMPDSYCLHPFQTRVLFSSLTTLLHFVFFSLLGAVTLLVPVIFLFFCSVHDNFCKIHLFNVFFKSFLFLLTASLIFIVFTWK